MAARVTRCVLGRVGFGWSWLGRGGEGDGAGAAGPERAQHTLTPAGQGMSPANRVSSARLRLATTITAHVCIHAGHHCLPHAAGGRGRLMLQRANSHHAPSPIADDASARRPATIAGQTERPTWARTLRVALTTPTNHRRAH